MSMANLMAQREDETMTRRRPKAKPKRIDRRPLVDRFIGYHRQSEREGARAGLVRYRLAQPVNGAKDRGRVFLVSSSIEVDSGG